MCLYPKLIKNRKYIANKKNGGNIPAVTDLRVLMVPVGCGKCGECMKKKSREWRVRLGEEIRENNKAEFVTFTFSNENIANISKDIKMLDGYNLDNEIATVAVRRFLERWRKKYKKSVKHWFITELGQKGKYEHIHLHGLIWSKNRKEIESIWKYGYVWFGEWVDSQTINYITKYITKIDIKHKYYKPKILCSKGIGKQYLTRGDKRNNKFKGKDTNELYKSREGYKMSLPIYYRNKIYTDEEKEKLWINLLNKNKRYVWGCEIDVSKNEDEYYKTLEYYRKLNKELGYGDDEINWDKKRYENELRNTKHRERIKQVDVRNNIEYIESNIIQEKNITGTWKEAF